MSAKAAATGPDAMAFVALEQGFPDGERILTDELAEAILPRGSRFWVRLARPFRRFIVRATEAKVAGLWGGIMARKRFIDDALAASPTDAVVNLGAGFDTRGCRLSALPGVTVWEVDLPANIDPKRKRLQRIFGQVPDHLNLVPLDFNREDLGDTLTASGYSSETASFFIWEGVTQYLTEEGFCRTFEFLGGAAPGSRLVFTYVPADYIEGNHLYGQEYLYEQMRVRNRVWHFGLDPDEVDGVLARYGWRTIEHLGYDELSERYVKPTGRNLGWIEIERIVHARKP